MVPHGVTTSLRLSPQGLLHERSYSLGWVGPLYRGGPLYQGGPL